MIGTAFGFVAMLLFLLLAAQVMLGLYATSSLRAVLHDAAAQAASQGRRGGGDLERLAREAESAMGRMGERTSVSLRYEDSDGDGTADVVVGDAVAAPPRVIPSSLGGMVGFEEVRAGVRVRIERVR